MSSALRCFELLDLLAQEPEPLTFSDIAGRLSVAKSSAHRFVATLIASGFVVQDNASRTYSLSGKALGVGTAYLRRSPVYRAGFEVLEAIAERAKTMSHLAILDNGTVLYLHTVGPPRSLHLFADTGERRPVHATALGKVMLAWRPADDVERLFAKPAERYTETTIVSVAAMQRELDQIRRRGYAVDDGECVPGLRCCAAAIRDRTGAVVAAVSVSGPAHVLSDEHIPCYARLVQEGALRISVQLGYHPRTSNLASLLTPGPDLQAP